MRYIKLFENMDNRIERLSNGLLNFFKEFDFLKDQVTTNRKNDDDYNIYLYSKKSESYYIFLKVYGNSLWIYSNHNTKIACMVDEFGNFGAHFNNDSMIKNTLNNIKNFLEDLQQTKGAGGSYLKLDDIDEYIEQLTLDNFELYTNTKKYNL